MSISVGRLVYEYDERRGANIIGCGRHLDFAIKPDGSKKLHRADFCRERLCPMCQWRRALRLACQCNDIYACLTAKGYQHVFVTLTVKNVPATDLFMTTDKLFTDLRKLTKSADFNRTFLGGYRAFELTYNAEDDTYHPHFHLLLTCPKDYFSRSNSNYMTHDELVHQWRLICKLDYDPFVRIQAIKPKEGQSMTAAAVEVAKYPTKVADALNISDKDKRKHVMMIIDECLRGRQLIGFFGLPAKVRRELKFADIDNGDLIHTDDTAAEGADGEKMEIISYVWRSGYYIPSNYTEVLPDRDAI